MTARVCLIAGLLCLAAAPAEAQVTRAALCMTMVN